MGDFINTVLRPLEVCVAWIMVAFHALLTQIGLPAAGGWTWALSIVGLVIVIRILLIPLFVKQIKASRGLQLIQPEMKKIQAKYKGRTDQASKQAMTQETMELYKRTGTNPFASCLPILLQSPIFFALFRVLNGVHGIASGTQSGIGALDRSLAEQMDSAKLFAAPLSETFVHATNVSTRVLTVVMIVLMSATTFTTQRQLMMKNMPAAALDNPFAQQQKVLLYVLPLVFAVSGVNFPIGVLIYWLTTNVWTMGQQFYVIRRMPAPGSPAEKALQDRRARRGHTGGLAGFSGLFGRGADPESLPLTSSNGTASSDSSAAAAAASVVGQRQQPKRQTKSRRSGARGPVSSSGGPESGAGPQNVAAQDEDEGERPTKGR